MFFKFPTWFCDQSEIELDAKKSCSVVTASNLHNWITCAIADQRKTKLRITKTGNWKEEVSVERITNIEF